MKKFNSIHILLLLAVFTLASCATAPETTTTSTTTTVEKSPMNRNESNGLASYMH
jgi:uncharacterized lipoprotein YajG